MVVSLTWTPRGSRAHMSGPSLSSLLLLSSPSLISPPRLPCIVRSTGASWPGRGRRRSPLGPVASHAADLQDRAAPEVAAELLPLGGLDPGTQAAVPEVAAEVVPRGHLRLPRLRRARRPPRPGLAGCERRRSSSSRTDPLDLDPRRGLGRRASDAPHRHGRSPPPHAGLRWPSRAAPDPVD